MPLPARLDDPYAPIQFPDGRVFVFQSCAALELCEENRIYRVDLELMEFHSQHLHQMQVFIYWNSISADSRRPRGETLLQLAKQEIKDHLDAARFPERRSSCEKVQTFIIGKEREPFI